MFALVAGCGGEEDRGTLGRGLVARVECRCCSVNGCGVVASVDDESFCGVDGAFNTTLDIMNTQKFVGLANVEIRRNVGILQEPYTHVHVRRLPKLRHT